MRQRKAPGAATSTVAASRDSGDAWHAFLDNVTAAKRRLGWVDDATTEIWFRGQASGSHRLLPSLFRHFDDPDGKDWQTVWQMEADLFWEFSARARELHAAGESDWDILFAMQHFGTPTRLLDWTEVLAVAVYFAVLAVDERRTQDAEGKPLPPPCVCVLNPYKLNEYAGWGDDLVYPVNLGWLKGKKAWEGTYFSYGELLIEGGVDWELPVAIYPRQRNARIHAQRGWFTIHGDEFVPLDTLDGHKAFLLKVDLPFEAIPAAREFLEIAGINHYSLFPDLASLSLHLREKLGLTAVAAARLRQSSVGQKKAGRRR